MDLLTQLPLEIVNHILSFVAPEDLARVNTVCWYLYRAVKGNSALFRAVYLNHLDPPLTGDLNWIQEIRDLVRLKRICASSDPNKVRKGGLCELVRPEMTCGPETDLTQQVERTS